MPGQTRDRLHPGVQLGQQRCRGQERRLRGAFLIDGDAVRPHADQVAPEHDRLGKQGRKEYPGRTCDAHAGPQRRRVGPFRVDLQHDVAYPNDERRTIVQHDGPCALVVPAEQAGGARRGHEAGQVKPA